MSIEECQRLQLLSSEETKGPNIVTPRGASVASVPLQRGTRLHENRAEVATFRCFLEIGREVRIMSLTVLLWFALTEFFLSLSPGPAVLLVVAQGMRHGARPSVLGSLGILTGNATYFVVSAAGVGVVLITSEVLFNLVKWTGAAYLVYLGSRMLFTTTLTGAGHKTDSPAAANFLFLQGLITQLANPKAIIFFTALLPQFIDPAGPVALQCAILGITSLLIEFPVLVGYGWIADKSKQVMHNSRWSRWVDRLAGVFLISAGVKLALERRP